MGGEAMQRSDCSCCFQSVVLCSENLSGNYFSQVSSHILRNIFRVPLVCCNRFGKAQYMQKKWKFVVVIKIMLVKHKLTYLPKCLHKVLIRRVNQFPKHRIWLLEILTQKPNFPWQLPFNWSQPCKKITNLLDFSVY